MPRHDPYTPFTGSHKPGGSSRSHPDATAYTKPSTQVMPSRVDQKISRPTQVMPSKLDQYSHVPPLTDAAMAARQTQYQSLPPHKRAKQEEWAQNFLRNSGICPAGWQWLREGPGYRCQGGHHFITDQLIAKGRGGFYEMNRGVREKAIPGVGSPLNPETWGGPFYYSPGMKPAQAPGGTPQAQSVQQAPSAGPGYGGPPPQSFLKSNLDVSMAAKQTRYNTLSGEERKQQDKWVHSFLKVTGVCPQGARWIRQRSGYICDASIHCITDQLIAEGKGGYLEDAFMSREMRYGRSGVGSVMVDSKMWAGPYYPDQNGIYPGTRRYGQQMQYNAAAGILGYPANSSPTAPGKTSKSVFTSTYDLKMAAKQAKYGNLSRDEKVKQDQWAKGYLENFGVCVMGVPWKRDGRGYVCEGYNHYISDELIAEGKGRFLSRQNIEEGPYLVKGRHAARGDYKNWFGPYYRDELLASKYGAAMMGWGCRQPGNRRDVAGLMRQYNSGGGALPGGYPGGGAGQYPLPQNNNRY
ncbi:hypothetical protein G7Y89_g1638 [Cudoniella acicularis]|uniref:Uncharacterized protein n=1 Tax=Cudoniella acicularis TaxID=354080 RepID=A0A8H4RUW5_9HELO|nr:hypothetical protein G7Y89_g1638 [Cudoniella acicularis]